MAACRSGSNDARLAASEMIRHMSDLSEDEDSPAIQLSNKLDGAQNVYEVGNQVAGLSHLLPKQLPPPPPPPLEVPTSIQLPMH